MENSLFGIYILVWGTIGVVFYFWDKNARSISDRKKISILGIILTFVLMIAFASFQKSAQGKWPAIAAIIAFMPVFIFISYKYTYYCDECGKRIQALGRTVKYCPDCGGELK
jgi:uncharacterized membrane protein HdeD (DUF308 family)